MSINLTPSDVPAKVTARSTAAIALNCRVDPRVSALISEFDAPFFQAGLAGYSDGAMRLIARQHGCPYCVTEALLDRTLISGGKGRTREDPDLLAEECGTGDPQENRAAGLDDHPIAGQIMGTDPDEMAEGAAMLVDMGYDAIDVNFACPVKKIRKRHRGGHFLAEPDAAVAVLQAVRDAVPPHIPTTVKLRRAFDDSNDMAASFERIFDAVYEIGYAWATVHCRTVEQKYLGPGRWPFLRDLTHRYPDRVIFGSGDVWTVHDIFAMLELTGVAAVSVARGCIGNPWIFRQARQMMEGDHPTEPDVQEQAEVLKRHLHLCVSLHGEGLASRLMRKFGIKFSVHHPESNKVKAAFVCCATVYDWQMVIEEWYGGE
ncbi:MAG: tRNA dihydrouridine synthase [Phycisphaerales bacterium]